MKAYRIKHKPTGLYFTPSKGSGNLSKKGKIYASYPRLEWAGETIRIVLKTNTNRRSNKNQQKIIEYFGLSQDQYSYYWIDTYFKCSLADWEVEEI
ncbi:MAG: hypothetical protein ACOC1K_00475 [Nanoarchaeota archaeon]